MLYYCGFDSFLQFKQKSGLHNVYLQPLSDLVLDRNDKVISAFLGWCSLFLHTGKGQILYLGYSKSKENSSHVEKNDIVVCTEIPNYVCHIECGAKETFLQTIDLDLYKWSGFNFAKTFPTHISLDSSNESTPENGDSQSANSEASKNSDQPDSSPKEQHKIESLSVGGEFSCLLTDSGKAFLFDTANGHLLRQLSQQRVQQVSSGQEHILLLTEDGSVLSYGRGSRGQTGQGNVENILDTEAVQIEALAGIKCKSIAAGGWHSMALSDHGDVYVWGWNESGQLGLSKDKFATVTEPQLLDISEDDTFAQISCGSRHSMVVSGNGILFGWGMNKFGQLGLDPKTVLYCDSPQVIPLDEKVSDICCKFWSSLIETERENGV